MVLFRNHLVNVSTSEILRLHAYAAKVVGESISVFDSAELAELLHGMKLAPAKIDIGKLSAEWRHEGDAFDSKEAFLASKLGGFMAGGDDRPAPRDVVLYGFGRIGRLCARDQAGKGQQLRLRAVVTRKVDADILASRAALIANDSVHGEFGGSIDVDVEAQCLVVNGQRIHMIAASDPASIDYTSYGIQDALVVDNTGVYRDREALSLHLQSTGVSKVLLTAPGKGTLVYGINHGELDLDQETVYSAASCTTNAISPMLKVIEDHFGVARDGALHQRSKPARQHAQEAPSRTLGGGQHGHHRDGCRQSRDESHPCVGGQAHRQRRARPHAQRLLGHPEPDPGQWRRHATISWPP